MKGLNFKWIGVAALTLLGLGAAVFFEDIHTVYYLLELRASVQPDVIDENFRTWEQRNPMAMIENQGQVLPLVEDLGPPPFPQSFTWLDKTYQTDEFIRDTNTTGMAIMHRGKLVYEFYDRGNTVSTQAIQMSVAKSYISFLVGTLLEDGSITSLQDPIDKYVPKTIGTAFEGVSIQHMLEMSSGVKWVEDVFDFDSEMVRSMVADKKGTWQEFFRTLEREREPGTYHRYASINMHALEKLVEATSGQKLHEAVQSRLWTPMGAEFPAYVETDGGMMSVAVRDMLRFGQLYLDGGRNLRGDQLISEDWVRESTVPDQPRLMPGADNPLSSSHHGYKYLWWVPVDYKGEFVALGVFGQFIFVDPANDVVIAKTSAYQNEAEDGGWKLQETVALFQRVVDNLAAAQTSEAGSTIQPAASGAR